MRRERPTLRDVAALAGVAVSTASRALSGAGHVSESTSHRVRSAVAKLGYVPDAVARGLVTGQYGRYLLLVIHEKPLAPTTWASERQIIEGLCDILRVHGKHLQISMCSTEDLESDLFLSDLLDQSSVDGVLVLSAWHVDHHVALAFRRRQLPFVLIGCWNRDNEYPRVLFENSEPITQLVAQLFAGGHRGFALISGFPSQLHMQQRRVGFKQGLRQCGLAFDERLVETGDYSIEGGYQCMRRLLSAGASFTAVVCGNDYMAVGALRALNDEGFEVPRDFAVVGFDDHEVARAVSPQLTTVRAPLLDVGQTAAKMLLSSEASQGVGGLREVVLESSVVERESTGSTIAARPPSQRRPPAGSGEAGNA